ncbi:MAG TPA: hypothetical protein VLB80_01005 [Candidatus Babeliales bacterium]|nr:hypothetical protein [Candidatus Babeliales bacterium]
MNRKYNSLIMILILYSTSLSSTTNNSYDTVNKTRYDKMVKSLLSLTAKIATVTFDKARYTEIVKAFSDYSVPFASGDFIKTDKDINIVKDHQAILKELLAKKEEKKSFFHEIIEPEQLINFIAGGSIIGAFFLGSYYIHGLFDILPVLNTPENALGLSYWDFMKKSIFGIELDREKATITSNVVSTLSPLEQKLFLINEQWPLNGVRALVLAGIAKYLFNKFYVFEEIGSFPKRKIFDYERQILYYETYEKEILKKYIEYDHKIIKALEKLE